tara:strand:- start:4234 stop:4596 length:363 start_codon:yes stop_codon:yes gene_type:complete
MGAAKANTAGESIGSAINSAGDSLGKTLTKAFNFAVKGVTLYLGLGVVDLALWHFDPGGVALFDAIKDPLLSVFDSLGVSDALNGLAGMLGGGTAQMAADLGGTELDLGGSMNDTFLPDY